jgi:hypothetical protein
MWLASIGSLRKILAWSRFVRATQAERNLMSRNQDTPSLAVKKAIRLAEGNGELFRDYQGRAYATLRHKGRSRTWLVDSEEFKSSLRALFFERFGRRIAVSDAESAVEVLAAKAESAPAQEVFVRVGRTGGAIVVDLCRDDGQLIRVYPGYWEIIGESPAKFRRARGMMALPLPSAQRANLRTELRQVLDLGDQNDEALVGGWLVGCLNPGIPQPVLELIGPQGAAKSTRTKMLRTIIDPNVAPVRGIPRDQRDLFITASNSWMLCLDNISAIPPWFSDVACSIATGTGFATRQLFKDEDEALFQVRRPVIVNSVHEVVARPDLRDRTITICLPAINPDERKLEAECWERFHKSHPRILAALFDCVAAALALQDSVRPDELPRMADWYRWVLAAAEDDQAFGFTRIAFVQAFHSNRSASHELAIDASPIGRVLLSFVLGTGGWHGTMTELLSELDARVEFSQRSCGYWPKSPEALRRLITRVAPDLLATGLSISFDRDKGKSRDRLIQLNFTGGLP